MARRVRVGPVRDARDRGEWRPALAARLRGALLRHWESFREYAEQLADDTGMMTDWPEEAARYFDWASWTRDLAFDFTVVDAPAVEGYGVYVFRDL